MTMEPILQAQSLCKTFGKVAAVQDVNLAIYPGEIYGLVGPDGAGKTTTLRMLCGALEITQGQASIAGYDVNRQTEQARAQIGYLSQRFSLYEDLTVMENIRFFAEVRSIPEHAWRERCLSILKFVGLDPYLDRKAGKLSGGMKQKLGLATALVHQPHLLLLDEPTTGVDPVTRQDFWQLIIRLAAEEKLALLVTTPYMDEAARCHRIGFMRAGRLLVEDTPAALRSRLADRIIEISGEPIPQLRQLARETAGVETVQKFGDRLHLRVAPGSIEPVLVHLAESAQGYGVTLADLRHVPAQLEDVFMALVES